MKDAEEEQLRLLQQRRVKPPRQVQLGENVATFMKHVVEPRHKKLAALAQVWNDLLPVELAEHTCVEAFLRGRLTILVDSAPHLHELNMLLRDELLEQLRQACPSANLCQVKLERGQWYRKDEQGHKIPTYQ